MQGVSVVFNSLEERDIFCLKSLGVRSPINRSNGTAKLQVRTIKVKIQDSDGVLFWIARVRQKTCIL